MSYEKLRESFSDCLIRLVIFLFAATLYTFCSHTTLSQSISIWTIFTSENSGLPNDGVLALALDADGAMWIGTLGGLVHLDKNGQWRSYTRASTNGGLPSSSIQTLTHGADSALW